MSDKRKIAIVTACLNANGAPEFVITEVAATQDEIDNGVHYYLAAAELLEDGYEAPFVHFDESESPSFLHPAVRQHLNRSTHPNDVALLETTHEPDH